MSKFQINKEIMKTRFELDSLLIYVANYFHNLSDEQVKGLYVKVDELNNRLEELRQMKKEVR